VFTELERYELWRHAHGFDKHEAAYQLPDDPRYFPEWIYADEDGDSHRLTPDDPTHNDLQNAWFSSGLEERKPHLQRGADHGPVPSDESLTDTERWLTGLGHEFTKRIHHSPPTDEPIYRGAAMPQEWIDNAAATKRIKLPLSSFDNGDSTAAFYAQQAKETWPDRKSVMFEVAPGAKSYPLISNPPMAEHITHGDFDVLGTRTMTPEEISGHGLDSESEPPTVMSLRQRSVPHPSHPEHTASRWFTSGWDDYDDDQRQSEEDAMWDEYQPNAEEQSWLNDDDNEIPEDEDAEEQARNDAIGSGFGTAEDAAHDELAHRANTSWDTYANLIPPKDHGSNGARPPMTMEPVRTYLGKGVMARHAADGRPIGHLMWGPDGEIQSVNTHPDFGGRGVANAMLHHARSNPEIYHDGSQPIHHSDMLTPHGERWARSDPHHTMLRNFTSVDVSHGAGTKNPYGNYLGTGHEYVPAHQQYHGHKLGQMKEDFMKAQEFTRPGSTLYGKKNPPPRQYVPPGAGNLDPHLGPKATTMNWGGGTDG
jgi:hypothetical protein